MLQQLSISERSGPGESQRARRIQVSGTSTPDARWAGEKLTWHEQAEDSCIPPFLAFPEDVVSNQPIAHTGGVWPEDGGVPTEGHTAFPRWLRCGGRRWAGSLSPSLSLCFRCCLFHCRNIKIPLQPEKKNDINLQLFAGICQCGHKPAGMDNLHRFICHDDRRFNVL